MSQEHGYISLTLASALFCTTIMSLGNQPLQYSNNKLLLNYCETISNEFSVFVVEMLWLQTRKVSAIILEIIKL